MRDADNIRQVEALGIDWMGFIFWPKSSRYVAEMPSYLPTKCKRVGVFVDASIGDVMTIAEQYQLDIIQLHGQESPSYITQLISHLSRLRNVKIIKAFNIATAIDFEATKRYEDYVPDDAERLSSEFSPLYSKPCAGLDLNSRFESAPGYKNVDTLKAFIKELNI